MKNRTILAMLLICCAWATSANAAQRAAAATCDRECLRGKVTQLLYALVKHDVKGLAVAALAHRVVLRTATGGTTGADGEAAVRAIVQDVPVPR